MKFTLAVTALALATSSQAFSPLATARHSSSPTALHMAGATETKTYTFTKSEEIFAEAKEVSDLLFQQSRWRMMLCVVQLRI